MAKKKPLFGVNIYHHQKPRKRPGRHKKRLSKSVKDLRNYEKLAKTLNSKQLLESYKLMKNDIEKTIKNGKIQ